mgnify:CR=1 FL=1|tara:strand:- start:306 stop:557 length:252 start_codon:yes stop_codon:yes gene_type:complete
MKNIKVIEGLYKVYFSMKTKRHGRSVSVSVGTYDSILDAVKMRDFVANLKANTKTLVKYDALVLVNEKREEMGYGALRNSQNK